MPSSFFQAILGPLSGQLFFHPVSLDTPLKFGPRKNGQSFAVAYVTVYNANIVAMAAKEDVGDLRIFGVSFQANSMNAEKAVYWQTLRESHKNILDATVSAAVPVDWRHKAA